MSYNVVPTVATGDWITAGWVNTYIGGNFGALWVGTTAGDMDYYTSATDKARRAIGSAYQALRVNAAANAPVWDHLMHMTRLYRSSTQNYLSGAAADINWNAEVIDDQGWHDNSSNPNRVTLDFTGYCIPIASIYWNKNAGGSGTFHLTAKIQKNGVDTPNKVTVFEEISAATKQFTFGGIPVSVVPTDYLSVNFVQDSGGSGDILGGDAQQSSLTVMRVR